MKVEGAIWSNCAKFNTTIGASSRKMITSLSNATSAISTKYFSKLRCSKVKFLFRQCLLARRPYTQAPVYLWNDNVNDDDNNNGSSNNIGVCVGGWV